MDTVVKTQRGAVRGAATDGVIVFKGIPYAAPPFGTRRFQPPRPAEAWDGVRDAFTYGPTVVKPPYFPPFDVLLPEFMRGELLVSRATQSPIRLKHEVLAGEATSFPGQAHMRGSVARRGCCVQ